MGKIDEMLIGLKVRAHCALEEFQNSERGDTNFISMIIIIGIVVVLAGTFLAMGNEIISDIGKKVQGFIGNPTPAGSWKK